VFYAYNPAGAGSQPPTAVQQQHSGNGAVVPPQTADINTQNQQYYEFQWRILNLCAEFYGAAEELVVCHDPLLSNAMLMGWLQKATPPLVLAQCYHAGPSSKVDPIAMLNEAKKICDTLVRHLNGRSIFEFNVP
jgi:hypothetical protein